MNENYFVILIKNNYLVIILHDVKFLVLLQGIEVVYWKIIVPKGDPPAEAILRTNKLKVNKWHNIIIVIGFLSIIKLTNHVAVR